MKKIIILFISITFLYGCSSTSETIRETEKNVPENNKPVVAESFYQDKYLNGIDFFARGNEPFWTLDIDFQRTMKFTTRYDINLTTLAVEGAKSPDADVIKYHSQAEGGDMIVTITKQDCQDNMSGEPFDYNVRVEVKTSSDKAYNSFEGCGKYLFDYRLNDIWVMQQMTGVEINKATLSKGLPTFEFNLKEMKFTGHAGCNNLMGKIELKGSQISFGVITSTLMACPDMQIEKAVVKAINNKTFNYEIDSQILTLENQSVKMVFKKAD